MDRQPLVPGRRGTSATAPVFSSVPRDHDRQPELGWQDEEDEAMGKRTVSLIIEWDNARVSELDRALAMLRELRAQAVELEPQFEAILLYDRGEIDGSLVEKAVAETGLVVPEKIDVRIEPVEGLGYYQLKNAGGKLARGDILVFVDSDVIPEPGWLSGILEPFRALEVQVVAGYTYIGPPRTVYEKAFALFWLFPLRSPDGPAHRGDTFHANNVALLRHTFERHPFPDEPIFRGHTSFFRALKADSIDIWKVPGARLMHPPPNGLRHFVDRAVCRGHDKLMTRRLLGADRHVPLVRVVRSDLRRLRRKVVNWREVGLNPLEVPAALSIGVAYHMLEWLGWALTRISPGAVPRWFPI